MARMDVGEAYDHLLSAGVQEQTLTIVTSINGYSLDTLEDVLFAHTGYRTFEQYLDLEEDEDEE